MLDIFERSIRHKTIKKIIMKNLKKISRENLKKVQGGRRADFCQPGAGDVCAQYGLECGFWYTYQDGVLVESHNACM
ncbi:hypothetical protein ACM40_14995 [Chryseobacterium sp. BLS98]|nr:hypothetical protein ACM40_14995 [Chryseobacterium sp. BLS98]